MAVEPFTNTDEFDNVMDGNSVGNMDFWNHHKISFHLVYVSRHQIDPLYEKTDSYPMDYDKSRVKPQAAKAKAKAFNMGSDHVISLRRNLWTSDFTLLRMRRYILRKK